MMVEAKRYICRAGETFDFAALALFGDEKYAAELLCANPEYDGEQVFTGGEELYIPILDEEETDDTAAISEKAPWKK